MRAQDLIEGKSYILNRSDKPVAVYEGKHGGRLMLADGGVFYGGDNLLRFTITNPEGVKSTVLLNTGADVTEPEETRLERERLLVERLARSHAAYAAATAFLTSLGLEVAEKIRSAQDESKAVALRSGSYNRQESEDSIEIEGLTIGKLKQAIATVRAAEVALA